MNIDLSKLPAPSAIETLSYDVILQEMKASFIALWPSYSDEPHDPITKVLEVAALRELLLRQSHNEKASQIMLAYALGSNLDALGALPWLQVARQVITPADDTTTPPTPAIYEDDARFRQRMLLAYNQLSTAGAIGSYRYHTLSASELVKDVGIKSPTPGQVLVSILSTIGDGTADTTLLNTVDSALSAEEVRPLTDEVIVQSATIINYSIDATIITYTGASSQPVIEAVQESIATYTEQQHRIGIDITLSGIYAALHLEGVQNVTLSGFSEIICDDTEAAYCTGIIITNGGTGV
jgi:phage-related baseplate assembly protein